MSRRGLWLGAIAVVVIGFWTLVGLVAAGDSDAATEPLELGKPSALASSSETVEHELSATESFEVQLFCKDTSETLPDEVEVFVDGVEVGKALSSAVASGKAAEIVDTFLLGQGQKYKWKGTLATCEYSDASMSVAVASGSTGATGPAGPTGPEGAGGGGGGSGKIDSFGPTAEAQLAEVSESVEVMGFCIIGTMLAGGVFVLLRRVIVP